MDYATIRAELERLLDSTAEHHQQLSVREEELAAAAELLSLDPRIAAAYSDGQADAYQRVQLLIQEQIRYLQPRSAASLVLTRLSDQIAEGQG